MRYWDASALIPLVLQEKGTSLVTAWLREDPGVILWGLTRLELASAIERRVREGLLRSSERERALQRAERIANDAHEVSDLAAVRVRGVALVARYPLRAADAAQLGAAMLVAGSDPSSLAFVALDRRLATAAQREGFRVLTWPD